MTSPAQTVWLPEAFGPEPPQADCCPAEVPAKRHCSWCGGTRFWQSLAWPDVVRCGTCYPPSCPDQVRFLDREEYLVWPGNGEVGQPGPSGRPRGQREAVVANPGA
jgi:hypothetical protein